MTYIQNALRTVAATIVLGVTFSVETLRSEETAASPARLLALDDASGQLGNVAGESLFESAALANSEPVPSDQERIEQSTVFYPRLIATGPSRPNSSDSAELASLLLEIEGTLGFENGAERLIGFLDSHPDSAWSPSLACSLALRFHDEGSYTKALKYWRWAWDASKNHGDPSSRQVAGTSIARRASLLASLGRLDELQEIREETQDRSIEPERMMELYHRAMLAITAMQNSPSTSYRCGSIALYNVGRLLPRPMVALPLSELRGMDSPEGGFSMADLLRIASENAIPVVAVRWNQPGSIPVPSVIHWNQNHYAAILSKSGDRYEVIDPTFGQARFIREEVIKEEASGFFLIPQDQLDANWRLLSGDEANSVRGKGQNLNPPGKDEEIPCDDPCDCQRKATGEKDDEDAEDDPGEFVDGDEQECGDCDPLDDLGMTRWEVTEPYISLWLRDTPMYYRTPRVGRFALRVAYHKREGDLTQPDAPEVTTFGKDWNSSWLSYLNITSSDGFSTFTASLVGPNGGGRLYTEVNTSTPEGRARTTITKTMSGGAPTALTINHISGAKTIYDYVQTLVSGSKYRLFMTRQISPEGLTNMVCRYVKSGTNYLLSEVLDELGQTNKVTYNTGSGELTWVKEVENPFQRKVAFSYESGGRLTNITDVLGISSGIVHTTFTSGLNSLRVPTSLVTPYGTTTFSYLDPFAPAYSLGSYSFQNGINRALLVTQPNGGRHLFMYRDDSQNLVVNGVTNSFIPNEYPYPSAPCPPFYYWYMYYRNSFYWGPKHVNLLGISGINNVTNLTIPNYQIARWRNWLHELPFNATLGTTINMERKASADGSTEGPYTWYSYEGKPVNTNNVNTCQVDPENEGTWQIPALIARVDPNGKTNYLKREFNSRGNITKTTKTITNPDGTIGTRINQYFYSGDGIDRLKHINANGHTNVWVYNGSHQVVGFTNVYGEGSSYAYNSQGLLSGTQLASGLITTNYYSGGYPSKRFSWEMVGSTPKYYSTNDYTFSMGNVSTLADGNGLTRTFGFDALNRLTNIAFPDGTNIARIFGNTNRPLGLSQFRDRLGNSTYFTWDSNKKLTAITNALGNIWRLDWCSCGQLDSITDAENNTTQFLYDLRGRRTKVTYPDGNWITNTYNAIGRLTARSNSFGTSFSFTFNQQGRPTLITSSLGNEFQAKYDLFNLPTNVVNINGITINRTFDALGRLASVSYPDTGVESFTHSLRGITSYLDQLGHLSGFEYDAFGRLTARTNANGEVNRFSYTPTGLLRRLTDARGTNTDWGYDLYGRVSSKTNHTGTRILAYQYSINGKLTNRWSAQKGSNGLWYDAAGNLTNVIYLTSGTVSYAYDKNNRLKTMVDGTGTSSFTFNSRGDLASEDGPWSDDKISYGYNGAHLRSSLNLQQPNAAPWIQSYVYETNLRLDSLTSPAGTFDYTPDTTKKRLYKSIGFSGGSQVERQFDSVGRVSLTRLKNSGGTVLDSHAYLYDVAGQPTRQTRAGGDYVDYTYDSTGQLLTALGVESGGGNRLNERYGYAYDAGGNLLRRTNSVSATSPLIQTFTVDEKNQLTSVTRSGTLTVAGVSSGPATSVTVNANGGGAVSATRYSDGTYARQGVSLINGNNTFVATGTDSSGRQSTDTVTLNLPTTVSFTYDANGNLLTDGHRHMAYDDENQLITVVVTNATKSEFVYDGLFRRRIRKEYSWTGSAWQQTNEVRYVYDGPVVIQERGVLNQPLVTYTRGLDLSGSKFGAGGIGGLLARTESAGSAYYHSDLGGNITALINGQQAIVGRYLYDSYGNLISMTGPVAESNLYRFSSKEAHPASGLSYYLYRYYDSNLQRWINRDPIGEYGGVNLFRVNWNNPLFYVDPDGLTPIGAGSGAVGGAIIGGALGGAIGGTLGTFVLPGGGTIGGAAALGGLGAAYGALLGGLLGDMITDAFFGGNSPALNGDEYIDCPRKTSAPDGPPPVPVPGAPEGKWVPTGPLRDGNHVWRPDSPVPTPDGGQPSASWDPVGNGHWDVDDGMGGRQRYDWRGNPISDDEAHDRHAPRAPGNNPAP